MLKLFSTIKRQRIPVEKCVRFLTTEEQLQLGYIFTKPLDPKSQQIFEKYRTTWFYSSHIDAHKKRLGKYGIHKMHAQLRKEEQIRIQTSPLPIALSHLTPSAVRAEIEQEYEEEEPSADTNEAVAVDPLEQRNIIAAQAMQVDDTRKEIYEHMQQSREELLSSGPDPYEFNKYPAAWMMDYETFDDTTDGFAEKSEYGTPGN